jgi:hypothetical protein
MLRRIPTLSVTDFAAQTAGELLLAQRPEQMRSILDRACDAMNEQQHWTIYDHRDFWKMLRDNLDVPHNSELGTRLHGHLSRLFGTIESTEYRTWCRQLIDGIV